jgi:TATA-binding protein-associated factor
MVVESLSKDWITTPFLRLLFQNLIVEERLDIRRTTLACWRTALSIMTKAPGSIENAISQQTILEWCAVMMTPLGMPIDTATFYRPSLAIGSGPSPEHHNVDRNMLTQDPALISTESTLKARVASATALASLLSFWPLSVCNSPSEYIWNTDFVEDERRDIQSNLAPLCRFN